MKLQQQQEIIDDSDRIVVAASTSAPPIQPPPAPPVIPPTIPHPPYQPSLLLAKLNSLNTSGMIKSSNDHPSSTAIDYWHPPSVLSGRWPGYLVPPFMHSAYSYYSYLMTNQLHQQQQQQLQPVKLGGGGGGCSEEDDEPFVDVESPWILFSFFFLPLFSHQ